MNKSHITKAVKYCLQNTIPSSLSPCSITGYPITFNIEEHQASKKIHEEKGIYYLFTVLMMLKNTKLPYKVFATCKGVSTEITKLIEPYVNKDGVHENG